MIYDDGCKMDKDMRIIECPKCHNEEFSDTARFCRICGQTLFNYCAGGDHEYGESHMNLGNARFCEVCGEETQFLLDGLLKPWDEVCKEKGVDVVIPKPRKVDTPVPVQEITTVDDDELPF